MRPTQFEIEIPDRPTYQPGSGPAMAPITLQPEHSDTGWVIAGTIDFEGLSQYVVTPVGNPAHRRPVRKEHILDWVSPRSYEDFEYEQFKKQTDEEWERENKILAKAAAIKDRRHRISRARERSKLGMSLSGYMQLEDSERGTTSGHPSSPEKSLDELSMYALPQHAKPMKQEHSVGFPQGEELFLKRRGPSSSSSLSSLQKKTPPKSGLKQDVRMTDDEIVVTNKGGIAPSTGAESQLPVKVETLILPTPRQSQAPELVGSGESSLQPHSTPSKAILPTQPHLNASQNTPRSIIGSTKPGSVQPPKPITPSDFSKPRYPKNITPVYQSSNGKNRPLILHPPSLSSPLVSRPIILAEQANLNATGNSWNEDRPKRKHQSSSTGDESPAAAESFETGTARTSGKAKSRDGKSVGGGTALSKMTPSRGRRTPVPGEERKKRKKKGSKSTSSSSSAALKLSIENTSRKLTDEQSKYFASMVMKQETKEDTKNGVEEDSDEVWDIHGILDDELLPVDGQMVRHYLCAWVGDYEPTWEPGENISEHALKAYEQKIKRRENIQAFDGAMDIDIDSTGVDSIRTWNSKTILPGSDNFIEHEDEGEDRGRVRSRGSSAGDVFTHATTDTSAVLLSPDENARSSSSVGSSAEDVEIETKSLEKTVYASEP